MKNDFYSLFLDVLNISMERYLSTDNLSGEEWREVSEYKGIYQISSYGRLKSLKRNIGKHTTRNADRILIPKNNGKGYLTFSLSKKNKVKCHYIHRLVAVAFLPNPENKPEVDHLNTNKNDNRLINLAWVSHLENQYNPITKLNVSLKEVNAYKIVQLSVIGDYLSVWNSPEEASRFTGISSSSIVGNIKHPQKSVTAGGYIFMRKEDYDRGEFELPILRSSSHVINTGIPSKLSVALFIRGELADAYPSITIAGEILNVSPSTISTMCKHNISGKYKRNEIKCVFFKDLNKEQQLKVRKLLFNKRKLAD